MSSYFPFWGTSFWSVGLIQLWIRMTRITLLMIDDLRLFDFLIYHTSMPYWGIFPFRLRVIDLHGATWLLPFTGCAPRRGRVCYFIMIPQWSLFWATQASCSTFVCHHASYSGRRFLDVGFDLDYEDHTFHVIRFPTYHISDAILGHIPFRMIFVNLHGVARSFPLTRYTPRRGPIRYFIVILQ